MINFLFPQAPPNPYAEQMAAMAEEFEKYRQALELIRDNSSDMTAVALANNTLMGIKVDFGVFVFPATRRQQ